MGDGIHCCEYCDIYFCSSCHNSGDDLCKGCHQKVASARVLCGCGYGVHLPEFQHCSRCHEISRKQQESQWYVQLVYTERRRLMMQCCACRVICCYHCDPNPDDVNMAGVAASEAWPGSFAHPQLIQYADCTFCCSRPEACSGLADFLKLAHELEGEHTSSDNESEGEGDDVSDNDASAAEILVR